MSVHFGFRAYALLRGIIYRKSELFNNLHLRDTVVCRDGLDFK